MSNMRRKRARRHALDPGRHVHHTGVVHQRRQSPKPGVDFLEHGQHLGFLRYISLHRNGCAAAGLNLLHQALAMLALFV